MTTSTINNSSASSGLVINIKDQKGQPIQYTYNSKGELTKITYADQSFETFTYDQSGNLTEAVERSGDTFNYTYDSAGRVTRKTFDDGTFQDYTYDHKGNLTSIKDVNNEVTILEYDAGDRLTKITYPEGRFLEYSYDSKDRRTQIKDHNGFAVNYSYDDEARLTKLTDGNGENIISYVYDSQGRLSKETNGNGTYTTYGYDDDGQVTSIINYTKAGAVNSSFDYTYDESGQQTGVTTNDGTWTYEYDTKGQLIKALFTSTNPEITDQDLQYVYDAAGNRTETIVNGVTTNYTANNLNQYTTVGDATYSYDADGNLISIVDDTQTWTYEYNDENRLIGGTTPEGIFSYEYDVLGNRIATVHNGERTEYLIDPFALGDVFGEYNGSGELVANYVHGNGLVCRFEGNNSAYYDSDYIGSTIGITNSSGDYINRYLYQPFGQEILKTETLANPFEFVGQWGVMDEANGLDFMRARYYSPSDGRFISPDPIGIAGGINLYGYVKNSPMNNIDPSGLVSIVVKVLKVSTRKNHGKSFSELRKVEDNIFNSYDEAADAFRRSGTDEFFSFQNIGDAAEVRKRVNAFSENNPTNSRGRGDIHFHAEAREGGHLLVKRSSGLGKNIYDLASGLTLTFWADQYFSDNSLVSRAANVLDFVNPFAIPKDLLDISDSLGFTNDTLQQDITLIEDGYITSLSDTNGNLIAESALTYGSSVEGLIASASYSQYLEDGGKFKFDNNIEILDNSDSAYLTYSESGGFTINFSDQNDQGEDVPTGSLEFGWNNIEIVDNLVSVTPDSDYDINISRKNADGEIVEQYSGTQDSATGILDLNGGAVDANGNPIGEWETKIVAIAPKSGAVVSKTATTTPDGEVISPWETSIEFTEEYAQFIISEAYRNTEEAIIGNGIGELFGSSLGQAIAGDNIFAQIGSKTALSTVLGNVGQSVGISLRNGFDLLDGVEKAFNDFSKDLFKNLQSNSLSTVSSFLTAELSEALDIPGDFGGQLLESYLGSEISNIANAVIGVDLTPWNPGALLGGYLARQVVSPETAAGAIGGSIGGAIGASIGTGIAYGGSTIIGSISSGLVATGGLSTALSSSSFLLGIPIVAAFAFAATAIGTIFGDQIFSAVEGWFDDHGYGNAYASITTGGSTFAGGKATGKDYDFIKSAQDVRDATSDTINALLAAMGSENTGNETIELHVHHQKKKSGFLGSNTKHLYWYKIYSKDETGNKTELYGQSSLHKWNGQQWVDALTINTLKNMNLAGGNLYMQRALQNSEAKTVEELFGDLQIASDYYQYLQNKDIIDLLIAMEPNSAFSAGWVITLIRAEELGLTEWSASDFAGGLPSFLDSLGLDNIVTPDDIDISINGTTLKLEISVDGQIVQTIEIEDFANKINYQQLAATADGSTVTGTEGNDIWIAENISSTFIDGTATAKNPSHDMLIGSNFADTINGGQGRDFIQGNGGNDLLIGGSNNDLIAGGDGDDTIHGDENNGFADIPTDITSDAAKPEAVQAFDGSRLTWFGGVETPEIELSRSYTPPKPDFNEDEVYGGAGNDKIAGGAGEDQLFGDEGSDTLYGDEGHDYLVGGADADIIYGGVGFDVASYEDATEGVTVDLANGTASDGDRLYSIEDVIGSSFNDNLLGDEYSNILDGGMGSDTIDGRGGRDTVSFFNSAYGVEINMNTGQAVTKTGENSSDTDTLINIEDAIASSHDDTLIGSTLGGGLDGGDSNDTIIIQNDDVDVANGAATYIVRGGEGIDTLSFATWNKSRGVEINLNNSENKSRLNSLEETLNDAFSDGDLANLGKSINNIISDTVTNDDNRSESGHYFDSIEKIIGSSFADKITGSEKAEIFDGGAENDVFTVSEGRDIYLLNRGSDDDKIGTIEIQTELDSRWSPGQIKFSHADYKELYPFLSNRKVNLGVNYDTLIRYGTFSEDDQTIDQEQSLVFGDDISYHDIFGGLTGIESDLIDLTYDKYFANGYPTESKVISKQELTELLTSLNLTVGIKADNSYVNESETFASQLTDTITIQGGGILSKPDTNQLSFLGFSEDNHYYKRHKKTFKDDTFTLTYQEGSKYDFGIIQPIERLGFANSGHIELGQIKYFKDGTTNADNLIAETDKATWLYGGQANDNLEGSNQADVLIGGQNNDLLQGNEGDDQYAYWLGDGHDIIDDQFGINTIILGGGITLNDIKLTVGKIDDLTNHNSFRDLVEGELSPDLTIEIYNPETANLTGSITVINFQDVANFEDKLRFAGDYEISIFDLLEQSGDKRLPTLTGTDENNTLTGTEANEAFWGLAGNDTMSGEEGDDIFYAHEGSDKIYGGDGSDTLDYSYASDSVDINLDKKTVKELDNSNDNNLPNLSNFNSFSSFLGLDVKNLVSTTLSVKATDKINSIENAVGSDFDDTLIGNKGENILMGGAGNDVINGYKGSDRLLGGEGDDEIMGGSGDDFIEGGEGNDTLDGSSGDDQLNGGAGNDTLTGGKGSDRLEGFAGDDLLYIDAQDTFLDGGDGTDIAIVATTDGVTLDLNQANLEMIIGNDGDDNFSHTGDYTVVMDGGDGNDTLTGGSNDDVLNGEDGNDIIAGGLGADILTGGLGADIFVYNTLTDSTLTNPDTITDFETGKDRIDLSNLPIYSIDDLIITQTEGLTTISTNNQDLVINLNNETQLTTEDLILNIEPISENTAPEGLQFNVSVEANILNLTSAWIYDEDGSQDFSYVDLWLQKEGEDWEDIDDILNFEPWESDNNWASINHQLDFSNYEHGTYKIWAMGYDQGGLESNIVTQPFNFGKVNLAPKYLQFNTDKQNYAPTETLTLEDAWVYDENGSSDLEFIDFWVQTPDGDWIDVSDADSFTPWSNDNDWGSFVYSLNLTELGGSGVGNHTLWGQTTDSSGAKSNVVTQTFVVDNLAPSPTGLNGYFDTDKQVYTSNDTLNINNGWVRDFNGFEDIQRIDFWLRKEGEGWQDIEDILGNEITPWSSDTTWGSFDYSLGLTGLTPGHYTLWSGVQDQELADNGTWANIVENHFEILA